MARPCLRAFSSLFAGFAQAPFSCGTAAQLASFHRDGFVLIRSKNVADPIKTFAAQNTHILAHFATLQATFSYRFWRFWNAVQTATLRHSIPLPLSPIVLASLNCIIGPIRPFLDSIFVGTDARLVELSSVISFPGSLRQSTHYDISGMEAALIVSGFVALEEVKLESGPTCVFPNSHRFDFHRHLKSQQPLAYPSSSNSAYDLARDGNVDAQFLQSQSSDELHNLPCNSTDSATAGTDADASSLVNQDPEAAPVYALLSPGDVLLFDAKIFHFGSANTSLLPRALLSFSFQKRDADGNTPLIDGFTYHCDDSVKDKLTLIDFADTSSQTNSQTL